MSLTLNTSTSATGGGGSGGARPYLITPTTSTVHFQPQFHSSLLILSARTSHIVGATPRPGKFDSKNRRNASSTTSKEQDNSQGRRTTLEKRGREAEDDGVGGGGVETMDSFVDDGFVMPKLEGLEPDFWEGSKWDGLGFFVQYMWAFGVVFAVIACGVAVATYNEGATDFKETPVYKESIQSQELLEGSDDSSSEVFESNPTEEAPSLE